ncbi:hypothetical protein [Compostimonas suwonensis]|uniref:hypothetical protein n=1 Tax=Compostimonas suwonensis TaxID=1048394 RepID=UPI0012FE3632|nr:hypothetical protein [Compostimonas suwonensis]
MDEYTVPNSFSLRYPTRLLFAAAVGALALSGLTISPAFADNDGLSGAPAQESGAADGRTRFSYQAAPGQHLDDFYTVHNTGTTTQTFTVFATDAFNTDDGGYGLLNTDVPPTQAGSWVTFADGAKQVSVPLEPGQSSLVPFSVDVPADAGPGDHGAGIVISLLTPNGEILVDKRVATRLYVRVPGDLQPNLTISNVSAVYNGEVNPFTGSTDVTFTVVNNGNVALGATTLVGASALFGIPAGEPQRGELSELLPGNSQTMTVRVPGVPQVGYLNPYVKLAPTVDEDALNPGPLREVSRDTIILAMPWLLLGLLVIAAIVFFGIRIRNKRDEKNARAWLEYAEAEALRKAQAEAAAQAPQGETVGQGVGAP